MCLDNEFCSLDKGMFSGIEKKPIFPDYIVESKVQCLMVFF